MSDVLLVTDEKEKSIIELSAEKPATSMISPVLYQLKQNKLAAIGLGFVLFVAFIAILAPVLPIADPNATQPSTRLAPPGTEGYLLGSDQLGRDILSRLIWGARISLMVGLGSTMIALVIGLTLGLISGYFVGYADHIIMRIH